MLHLIVHVCLTGQFVTALLSSQESWEQQPGETIVRGKETEWFVHHALPVRKDETYRAK